MSGGYLKSLEVKEEVGLSLKGSGLGGIRGLVDGGGGGYLALVQFLLLFKSDTWVMYPHIDRTIGGFHHRVVLRLVWNYTRHQEDGIWSYPQLETAMSVAVL